MSTDSGHDGSGRFAYDGLERIFHEKARLGILTSLASHADGVLFTDLKGMCSLTDGNLSRHLQALADAGLVRIWKRQRGRRAQTLCKLTDAGRDRFLSYITELEKVVKDALDATAEPSTDTPGLSPA